MTQGSTADLTKVQIESSADGANAVFATGSGAQITARDITIRTTGDSSRGLDATYGAQIEAENVSITTQGAHCAPVATDRGEGTIVVNGGTLSAAGDGSPCVYSTGDITLSDVTGTAADSQAAVVEGKNSLSLTGCSLTGAGLNGVMLYQSTSGDAAEGEAQFEAVDSTLATTSQGPMFYLTNTEARAVLTRTQLSFTGGVLADVAGNETNNWGTPGENGGHFTLVGIDQALAGRVTCDAISTVKLQLTQGAVFTGAVNSENTAQSASVSLDADSAWTLTDDCWLTVFENELVDCSNIISNGYTLYYDAENEANAWLCGESVALTGGGMLTPAP